jgi:hypothetical protein
MPQADGPDFTNNACSASTTLTYTRNAGHPIWCGGAAGHEGNHHWAIEWTDSASDE